MNADTDLWYSTTLLGSSSYVVLWSFILYSFAGVLVETIFCLICEGILESRVGLLYLPLRPIYGIGGAACILLGHRISDQPVVMFLAGVAIGSVVEYVAAFAMERAFGTASWDYHDKPLNLHGRICLAYSCGWGLLALPIVYVVNPVVVRIIHPNGHRTGHLLLTAILVLTALSAVLTVAAWSRTSKRITALTAPHTDPARWLPPSGWDRLIDRLAPDPVLLNTFPRMTLTTELAALTGQQPIQIRVRMENSTTDRIAARRLVDGEPSGRSERARWEVWLFGVLGWWPDSGPLGRVVRVDVSRGPSGSVATKQTYD